MLITDACHPPHTHISVQPPDKRFSGEVQYNQTLKRMLRKVVTEEGHDWDLLRETIPTRLGERGLGITASSFRSVIEYILDMQDKINKFTPIVRQHMVFYENNLVSL